MAIQTQRYIRKPVYVEAVRITSANFDEIVAWCQGEIHEEAAKGPGLFKKVIKVRVQHPKNPRQTKAYVGDWLLYTDTGYKVYTNKAFRASFDLTVEPKPLSEAIEEAKTEAQIAEDERAKEVEILEEAAPTPIPASSDISVEVQPIGPVSPDPEAANGALPTSVATYQGKRVLSVKEQEELTVEEVRTLVQSGEAVLVQDVPRSD